MKKYWILILLVLGLELMFLFNFKFTAWPEMTLWPYLFTKGWMPYRDIAMAHNPLMIVDLSIFYKLFGVGIIQLKIFTWLLILLANLLVFFVANKIWGKRIAFLSLMFFPGLLLFFDGNGLWFDLYMGVLAFYSFYCIRSKRWFWVGVFWALAFLSKQTAVWFLIPIAFELVINIKTIFPKLLKLILGTSLVLGLFVLSLALLGILPDYYNWAIKFGIFILPKAQGQIQMPDLKNLVVALFPFSVFLPLVFGKEKHKWILLFWAVAGCMGAYPRFEYFHFLPSAPFIAISAGIVLVSFAKLKNSGKIFVVLYIFGMLYLFGNYFMRNWREGTRFYEGDVRNVVDYVVANTKPGDKIFVMNWWDNIYALTNTLPATNPWVPQLSWYQELPGIQDAELADLKISQPGMVVLNPYTDSGLSAYMPQKVYDYIRLNYKLENKIGDVEILTKK
jgi:hypothetical protein